MSSIAPDEQIRKQKTDADAAPELSVVLPCLNEARTLPGCIAQIRRAIETQGINAEIIVADNGSTDGSREIATDLGAQVTAVPNRGYGSALMGGIAAARGRYIIMGDADASYDFADIPKFLEKLRAGADLVMGNRFRGGIEKGAMPFLHRKLGNPVLSFLGRLFFHSPCGDFHCGLRGFSMQAYRAHGPADHRHGVRERDGGEGVVVRAEDRRSADDALSLTAVHPPHLHTWRDGWRHLRFLMMYSPRWSFLYPGLALMIVGTAVAFWLLPGPTHA